jgi:hypothetical protein
VTKHGAAMRIPIVCRVCGRDFVAARFDALTCTDTCRQRLRRGGELAYLAGLGKKQQRLERNLHDSYAKKRQSMAKTRSERADRTPRGGQPTIETKGGNGSACDINWENHREDDSESDAIVRARAVDWQLYEAERLALEFALCRPGTQVHEIKPKFIKKISKVIRAWKKLEKQLKPK